MTLEEITTAQASITVKLWAIDAEGVTLGWTDADVERRQELVNSRTDNRSKFKALAAESVSV